MSIKVLIADDHPILRYGLTAYLDRQPDICVVGEAEDIRRVVSILSLLDRSQTGAYMSSLGAHELGGGNLTQTYVWMEKFDLCDPLSYLRFLLSRWQDIEEWDNFYPPNTEPIPEWEEPF